MSTQKPREIAVSVLLQRRENQGFTEDLLETELSRAALSPADRGLCQTVTYGTARWQRTLDFLIARKTKGRPQKPALQAILSVGLFQMLWLDRIPDHAAVHETVELAKKRGFSSQAGFVNAVLRAYARERDDTVALLEKLRLEQPAVGYSHPDWLVERWLDRWGIEKTRQSLEWNNAPAPTFARVNSGRTTAIELQKAWETEGVSAKQRTFDWVDDAIVFELLSTPPLAQLPSFRSGFFYIQDPSTLLAVKALDPQPGETILDLCAAPGGKTTYMAQLMGNRGEILGCDTDARRLVLLKENFLRLGFTCITPQVVEEQAQFDPNRFDRVLIDAPCSNTGVLRRRVDLRWRVRPEEVRRLRETQLRLLETVAPAVKPGGILVYSTCSIEPEENQEVVQAFLASRSEFQLETERDLLPFRNGVDGAYAARLRRNR